MLERFLSLTLPIQGRPHCMKRAKLYSCAGQCVKRVAPNCWFCSTGCRRDRISTFNFHFSLHFNSFHFIAFQFISFHSISFHDDISFHFISFILSFIHFHFFDHSVFHSCIDSFTAFISLCYNRSEQSLM